MLRAWLNKILFCFSYTYHRRRKEQRSQSVLSCMNKNQEKNTTVSLHPSVAHTFSTPLKLCMLRKVRCHIQSCTLDNTTVPIPLSMLPSKQLNIASFLNESQNCAAVLNDEYTSSMNPCKNKSSLIVIDLDDNEVSPEQPFIKQMKQLMNFDFLTDASKFKKHLYLHRRPLIRRINSDSSLSMSSHYTNDYKNQMYDHLTFSTSSVHKQISDSIIFVHQHSWTSNDRSPYNINSITYDSPVTNTIMSTPSSISDVSTPANRKHDNTLRLQIRDDLNKDGSRHFVMHKDSEELVRQRRDNKRAQRSEEKKRKIEEKILKANERWQKYSTIDDELVSFIARYYDQLPLCTDCRNYFVTYQAQFLADDPRASLDYAADVVLQSPNNKTMTQKQAAKARLIKDYDKQTNILFNLCEECLTKCERIHTELKQINFVRKISNETNSPKINLLTTTTPELQSQFSPSFSPNIPNIDNHLFSPPMSSPVLPSPLTTNFDHQQNISSTLQQQYTTTDLNQIYMNNLIQNHQIRLQQLYRQSQDIILAQQYQQNHSLTIHQQYQLNYDLQSCLKQMQYHYLELLHFQYPGYTLSYPYRPSFEPQYLSYRYEKTDDAYTDTDSSSSLSKNDVIAQNDTNSENKSGSLSDDNRYSLTKCDNHHQSNDDRLTIETCHGLIEYCNAPLDDFIRGLQVLKCLSNFNCYSS